MQPKSIVGESGLVVRKKLGHGSWSLFYKVVHERTTRAVSATVKQTGTSSLSESKNVNQKMRALFFSQMDKKRPISTKIMPFYNDCNANIVALEDPGVGGGCFGVESQGRGTESKVIK